MKKLNDNHLDWSAEKNERKIRKHRSDEACKCFAPFLKLHWHDCPIVNKPCPIHGSHFDCNVKKEKEEPEQNVTISFYPSSKTERLFQPVKNLLAQCNPETKINLQYFSSAEFPTKSSFKHQLIQTSSEDLRAAALNNNIFVEKSKSFTTDKTNKMKKLKQCFHSPCNSIAKKSRSQVSFRERMNEIFRDDSRDRNAFFNMNLEEPRDDAKYGPAFEWFTPSKVGLDNLEKLSDEKRDSDFITFTQHAKNNIINHKIFEIKHKKGLNDISKVRISKEPIQFVYTSFASKSSVKEQTDSYHKEKRKGKITDQKRPEKREKTNENQETSSVSGNSQSSSSGSVYVTPFFLMPTGVEDTDSDHPKVIKTKEHIQTEGATTGNQLTASKDTQTSSQRSVQKKQKLDQLKSVSLQTKPSMEEKHSQCTKEIFLHDYEPSMETVDEKFEDAKVKALGEDFSDDSCWKKKCYEIIKEKRESSKYTKTIEVQTSNNYRYKEVCVSTRCDRSIRDETSQTETLISESRRRTFEPTSNKFQTGHASNKQMQTSLSDNGMSSDASKIIDLDSSELIRCPGEIEQVASEVPRPWWGKSLSESELHDKKRNGGLKADGPNPLSQNCCCKCSNLTHGSGTREYGLSNTFTKIFEISPQAYESTNRSDSVPPAMQLAVEHVSKAEQTSLIEEDCADLSELKKIIQDFFEKRDPNSGRKPDSDTPRVNKSKTDRSTTTESFIYCDRSLQDLKNSADVETQTTVHVLMDDAMEENHTKLRGQRVKFRQSVLLDDENQTKTFFICALCGREINKFSVNASTNTENPPTHPKAKEKTTVIDTEINEVITVKTLKKSQNVDSSTANSKPAAKQVPYSSADSPAKPLKSAQNSPRAINFQRSCIPILISGPGSAHLRYDETITVSENLDSQPLAHESLENQKCTIVPIKSKPQNQRPSLAPQAAPQCLCNIAGPSESKTSKTSSSMSKTSKVKESRTRQQTDIHPSLPRAEHPGVQNSQWRNERLLSERGNQRKPDGYFYPVIINSFWPREFVRTWESMEKYDNRFSISSNQKRSYEKDTEKESFGIPAEKKIKPYFDESRQECFVFGNSSFSDLFKKERHRTTLGKSTGFIWVPSSSVPQMSSRNNIINHIKATKSEELLKISRHQHSPIQVEKFGLNNQSEIFTVKSCHLKPVTSFNRLLECSFCNSIRFLNNTDKTDATWSKSNTSYQPRMPERTSNERVPEEPTRDSPFHYEEEFLRDCSHCSDDNDVPESLENNVSEEEITEVFEETYSDADFLRPKLQSQSQIEHAFEDLFNLDVATTSKSLNTFWFDGGTKKNFSRKSFK